MQVDDKLEGDPIRNLWAAVIMTALDDLRIKQETAPRWSSGISRQLDRKRAIWFFSCPHESSLSWICEKLQLDLGSTIKRAREINPAVKKSLSFGKGECYHKDTIKKAVCG